MIIIITITIIKKHLSKQFSQNWTQKTIYGLKLAYLIKIDSKRRSNLSVIAAKMASRT